MTGRGGGGAQGRIVDGNRRVLHKSPATRRQAVDSQGRQVAVDSDGAIRSFARAPGTSRSRQAGRVDARRHDRSIRGPHCSSQDNRLSAHHAAEPRTAVVAPRLCLSVRSGRSPRPVDPEYLREPVTCFLVVLDDRPQQRTGLNADRERPCPREFQEVLSER